MHPHIYRRSGFDIVVRRSTFDNPITCTESACSSLTSREERTSLVLTPRAKLDVRLLSTGRDQYVDMLLVVPRQGLLCEASDAPSRCCRKSLTLVLTGSAGGRRLILLRPPGFPSQVRRLRVRVASQLYMYAYCMWKASSFIAIITPNALGTRTPHSGPPESDVADRRGISRRWRWR